MMTTSVSEKISIPIFQRKKFRAAEFYKMMEIGILREESGWEIIDGAIVEKVSISSCNAGTVGRLSYLLKKLVGEKAIISNRNPIHIDDYNEPEPDIALLKPREDFYRKKLPEPKDVLLLIEVSDSTIEYDREIKRTLYARAGIEEFWLVNLKDNTIECFSSPKNENYRLVQILEKGETVKSKQIENLTLKVEEILGS